MKRKDLIRHIRDHGGVFIREGGNHSWWGNPAQNRRSSIPRHVEINEFLARKICKDLGLPFVK